MTTGKGNIVWLASYPKSGNTWFRVFLSNLYSENDEPVSINELHSTPIASSRSIFDESTGVNASDLSQEEIENLRPGVYLESSREAKEIYFQKVHDAWKLTSSGRPLFPAGATRAVLYFIRNPLDVAVSFAHHSMINTRKMAEKMNDPGYAFCEKPVRIYNQLRQDLNTWSGHVQSWVDESGLPVKVLRYEDMKTRTYEEFRSALEFCGLTFPEEKIRSAIRNSEFKTLKSLEEKEGFQEKPIKMKSFFRKGESDAWREELDPSAVKKIQKDHGPVMKRFGYL